jgi:putative transcriptional regulator
LSLSGILPRPRSNEAKHDISFELAISAFNDSSLTQRLDEDTHDEDRWKLLGMTRRGILDRSGQVWSLDPDGAKTLVDVPDPRPMTDEEVTQAALADPDAQPLDISRLKPVPRARSLRLALQLTPEEFANRYHIPVGTLRDWEQGRSVPDAPARAYLEVIAAEPEMVAKAFERAA